MCVCVSWAEHLCIVLLSVVVDAVNETIISMDQSIKSCFRSHLRRTDTKFWPCSYVKCLYVHNQGNGNVTADETRLIFHINKKQPGVFLHKSSN